MMKKKVCILLSAMLLIGLVNFMPDVKNNANAEAPVATDGLQIGAYIQLGKYYNEPVLWRYAAEDDNGKLILSDKIICAKPFGINNFWEESLIRKWLNSNAPQGEINWGGVEKSVFPDTGKPYDMEKGFLNKDNFTADEIGLMKSVSQWTMLPREHVNLATNGIDKAYTSIKAYKYGHPLDGGYSITFEISEFPEAYFGAAYQVRDKVFLLDEMQIYHIWNSFGTVYAKRTDVSWPDEKTKNEYEDSKVSDSKPYSEYFLRTPKDSGVSWIYDGIYDATATSDVTGIRPAFYLDTKNAVIKSGAGTVDDPYVLDGKKKDGLAVLCNGSALQFDQSPIMENDRVLVPMRKIFETLGAEVSWEDESKTVTAKRDGVTITMQIDNPIMTKNGEEIKLDVPPRLVGDRTLVPIRAVAEGLGAVVEWDESLGKVNITASQ